MSKLFILEQMKMLCVMRVIVVYCMLFIISNLIDYFFYEKIDNVHFYNAS